MESYTARPGLEEVHEILTEMMQLMARKGSDYSGDGASTFVSFERIAAFSGITVDQAFMALIGIKVARLQSLNADGRAPNNESLLDTVKDLANYSVLYLAYNKFKENRNAPGINSSDQPST